MTSEDCLYFARFRAVSTQVTLTDLQCQQYMADNGALNQNALLNQQTLSLVLAIQYCDPLLQSKDRYPCRDGWQSFA